MEIVEPRREARLDPGGGHVLCGSQHEGVYRCSREFGPVLELPPPGPVAAGRAHLILHPEPRYERPVEVALRAFRFPDGWAQRPDGVWDRQTAPVDPQRYGHYRDILAWWSRLGRLPRPILAALHANRPPAVPALPARAVCQRCRTISRLTAEQLRVSSPLPTAELEAER